MPTRNYRCGNCRSLIAIDTTMAALPVPPECPKCKQHGCLRYSYTTGDETTSQSVSPSNSFPQSFDFDVQFTVASAALEAPERSVGVSPSFSSASGGDFGGGGASGSWSDSSSSDSGSGSDSGSSSD